MAQKNDNIIYIGEQQNLRGKRAFVVALDAGPGKPVGLEFDEPIPNGHSCDGAGGKGYCWWARRDEIKVER